MDTRKPDILIVDDTLANLQLLAGMLKERGYKVRPASNGAQALQAIEKKHPDLILLDIKMPGMDGYQVCETLKKNPATQTIPVLFISALSDVADKVKAFAVGGLDYINKPFQVEEVLARVSTQLQLKAYQDELGAKVAESTEQIKLLTRDLIDSQREIILLISEICETRSHETGLHIKRVSEYCYLLARLANSDQAWPIKQAAPMHDVGKVGIPDHILLKKAKLNDQEWEIMKTHAELGYKMLSASHHPLLHLAAVIAHEHHERWDGRGYPRGLMGEQISLAARITAIADVFDALGHARCYKKAWPLDEIIAYFKSERGRHFDPALLDLFLVHLDQFLEIGERHRETNSLEQQEAP